MDKFWKAMAIAAVVLVLVVLYWTRYQVVAVNYAYAPAFYKINRLSGQTILTVGKEFVLVKEVEERMAPGPEQGPAPGPALGPALAPAPAQAPKK